MVFHEQVYGDAVTEQTSTNVPVPVRAWKLTLVTPAEEFAFAKASQNKTTVNGKQAIVLDAGATTSQDKRERAPGQALAGTNVTTKNDWALALEDWVDCLRTGRKPFCDGRIGLADTVCVVTSLEAMEKGSRVKISDDLYHV